VHVAVYRLLFLVDGAASCEDDFFFAVTDKPLHLEGSSVSDLYDHLATLVRQGPKGGNVSCDA